MSTTTTSTTSTTSTSGSTTLSSGSLDWSSSLTTADSSDTATLSFSSSFTPTTTTVNDEFAWVKTSANYAPGVGKTYLRQRTSSLRHEAVFVNNLLLDDKRNLSGSALVVCDGNLTVTANNVTRLKGIVYVKGDAIIDGDFQLTGMLIVRGQLKIGYGTAQSRVIYDPNVVQTLKRSLERYRVSRSIRPGWSNN